MIYWKSGENDCICIYIDESGDLGFNFSAKDSPSEYFTLSAIRVREYEVNKKLKRVIKKTKKRRLDRRYKGKSEFKFSNSIPAVRRDVISQISQLNLRIYSLTMFKRFCTSEYLKNDSFEFYIYLVDKLFKTCLNGNLKKPIYVFFDRCISEKREEELFNYITKSHSRKLNNAPSIEFLHINSKKNPCVQAADFVAGGIGHKYKYWRKQGSDCYYNMLEPILNHKEYFNKNKKICAIPTYSS